MLGLQFLQSLKLALGGTVTREALHIDRHGEKRLAEALGQLGHVELVAKDPQSPYVGGRTLKWLKVKMPRYREGERGWEPKK